MGKSKRTKYRTMKYMLRLIITALLSCATLVSGFVAAPQASCVPTSFGISSTTAINSSPATEKTTTITMDENFDGIDIVRLLGMRRLKKLVRKNKRLSNAALREEEEKNKPYVPKGRWRKRVGKNNKK